MAVEKTKHQFVDDNPYLVYSGEPESTLDNAGGGGGGGGGVTPLVVNINEDMSNWQSDGTTITSDVTPVNIFQAIQNNVPVIVKAIEEETNNYYFYLRLASSSPESIAQFVSFVGKDLSEIYKVEIYADSISGYSPETS